MGPITGEAPIDAGEVAPELDAGTIDEPAVDDEEAIQAEPEVDTDLGREKR